MYWNLGVIIKNMSKEAPQISSEKKKNMREILFLIFKEILQKIREGGIEKKFAKLERFFLEDKIRKDYQYAFSVCNKLEGMIGGIKNFEDRGSFLKELETIRMRVKLRDLLDGLDDYENVLGWCGDGEEILNLIEKLNELGEDTSVEKKWADSWTGSWAD